MKKLSWTWLGHATFLFHTPGGKRVLLDPWIATNPVCPEESKKITDIDIMLLTHGHDDHTADALPIGRATGAHVITTYELGLWLQQKGLQTVTRMAPGGTIEVDGLTITMVQAVHSSSVVDEGRVLDLGCAVGFIVRFEDGTTIYLAGDTAVFGDMRLIAEMYHPSLAVLPIGDLFTMGPEQAAKACELLSIKEVVPMHYGTFPALTGTPARLRALVEPHGVKVMEMKPGETADQKRYHF